MSTAFANDQECLILQGIWQIDPSQLQATEPTGHLHFPEGIKHFTKLLNGFLIVSVRFHSLEPIQFLIVIIFDFLADGSQQTITFAGCPQQTSGISCASGISEISPRSSIF